MVFGYLTDLIICQMQSALVVELAFRLGIFILLAILLARVVDIIVMQYVIKNVKSSCGITRKRIAYIEWQGPSPCHSACECTTQLRKKRCSGGERLATVSDLTGPGIEPLTSRADNDVLNHYVNWMMW